MSATTDYHVLHVRSGFPDNTDENEDPGHSTNIRGLQRENGTKYNPGTLHTF